MKAISIILLSVLFLSSNVLAEKTKKVESPVIVEIIDGAHVYGSEWPLISKSYELDKAILSGNEALSTESNTFTGRVTKVCQNSGCWMMLEKNGHFARVDFNDHSFFIPKDFEGEAQVYGVLKEKLMSDKKRAHLKEDGAGDLPEKAFEIVATSVMISSN